jgi:N-acetylmuramoyl-L-alanine amidase
MLSNLLSFLILGGALWSAPLKVVIDPGHGGTDAGAVYGPAKESEIALKVALHLKSLIDQSPDFSASLTRESDRNVTLQERVKIAESEKGEIFLSIHANASTDQRARGVEFYFQNHLPPDEETLFLASTENQIINEVHESQETGLSKKGDVLAILEDLKRTHKMKTSYILSDKLLSAWGKRSSDSLRQAPFFVVSRTSIPSVLIELGFISNPKESQKLVQSDYQREIAHKIFKGLVEYKEMVDKASLGRLQ